MLYSVVTYANMRGVRAVDRIVDLCQRDLAFIWLTKGQKPQRDVFYDFKGKKLTGEVLDELNHQFMRRLNYHLVKLLDSIDALYAKYNAFLLENGYGPKSERERNPELYQTPGP